MNFKSKTQYKRFRRKKARKADKVSFRVNRAGKELNVIQIDTERERGTGRGAQKRNEAPPYFK